MVTFIEMHQGAILVHRRRNVRSSRNTLTLEQTIVVGVRSDPEPIVSIAFQDRQGPVVAADPSTPDFSYFLKAKRRMPWVSLPEAEVFASQCSNVWMESLIGFPEPRDRRRFRRAAWFFLRRFRHRPPQSKNPSARRLRLLRSGDPILRCGAPAIAGQVRRTLGEKAEQPSLRSLLELSRRNISFDGAMLQWGRTRSHGRGKGFVPIP